MTILQTLATSVAALQSQASYHGQGGRREEARPALSQQCQLKITVRASPRFSGASVHCQVPRVKATSPPTYHQTEDGTLTQQAVLGVNRQAMATFPDIFTALTDESSTPRARLDWLATLPFADRLPVMTYTKEPDPHIRVIWGLQ